MKKYIATIVLAGLAAAAQAENYTVYITGATAFRDEIFDTLNVGGGFLGGVIASNSPTLARGTGTYTFQGTYLGDTVTVEACYSGSGAGVGSALNLGASPAYVTIGNASDAQAGNLCDFAFSDVKQNTTQYPSPKYTALSRADVAIVPFLWVHDITARASLAADMTPQIAQTMFFNAGASMDQFTGAAGDEMNFDDNGSPVFDGNFMLLAGRAASSGTRMTSLSEIKYGVNTPVQQAQFVSGVWTNLGNAGYGSGGAIAIALTQNLGNPVASYLGVADAKTLGGVVTGTTIANNYPTCVNGWMTYCGVPYTYENVIHGKYSFWTVENFYTQKNGVTAKKAAFGTALLNAINNYIVNHYENAANPEHDQPTAIDLNSMEVTRLTDGGVIGHN
jgi:hypothetical protein